MEWLRSWLLSVTCAAMIAALANALCPRGLPKKLVGMAGGLLLLLATLGPVAKLDESALADFAQGLDGYAQTVTGGEEEMRKSIIAGETAAYISDKAAALGIEDVAVTVQCRMTEDGFPAPDTVTVRGRGTDAAWDQLNAALGADFAFSEDGKTFERMDVP